MILLIDNYDSFVHNIARYISMQGYEVMIYRNDAITIQEIEPLDLECIVLSPGPGAPKDAGICMEVMYRFAGVIPILGICLGHQVIAEAFGGKVIRATNPMHGRDSYIEHTNVGVFANLSNPCRVGRYHSLVVNPDTVPECLEVIAITQDKFKEIMAIKHIEFPIVGLQFHPESVLTPFGSDILGNFLTTACYLTKSNSEGRFINSAWSKKNE